jgi:hypothetical protein
MIVYTRNGLLCKLMVFPKRMGDTARRRTGILMRPQDTTAHDKTQQAVIERVRDENLEQGARCSRQPATS